MLILMPAQLRGRTIQIHLRLMGSLAIFQEIGHDAPDHTRGKQRQRPGISGFKKFSSRAEPRAFGALHYCSGYGESVQYGCSHATSVCGLLPLPFSAISDACGTATIASRARIFTDVLSLAAFREQTDDISERESFIGEKAYDSDARPR